MKAMSYYSTCESCDTVLEGIGKYDEDSNTLYGNSCTKCGEEFTVSGWIDEEENN